MGVAGQDAGWEGSPLLGQSEQGHVAQAEVDQVLQQLLPEMVLDGLGKERRALRAAGTVPFPGPGTEASEAMPLWKVSQAKALRSTDLFGEQSSMLILHSPILGKHIIKLLDDFRAHGSREERKTVRPSPQSQVERETSHSLVSHSKPICSIQNLLFSLFTFNFFSKQASKSVNTSRPLHAGPSAWIALPTPRPGSLLWQPRETPQQRAPFLLCSHSPCGPEAPALFIVSITILQGGLYGGVFSSSCHS